MEGPERGACLLVPLYCEGLILAQMLVEVAGRYHYSLIPMLILLGCGLYPAAHLPVQLRDGIELLHISIGNYTS